MKTHANRSRYQNNLSASRNSYEVQIHSSLMTITKKLLAINAGEEEEEEQPLFTACGNVSWSSHDGNQYGGFSKI